jgi:hypothetical protein
VAANSGSVKWIGDVRGGPLSGGGGGCVAVQPWGGGSSPAGWRRWGGPLSSVHLDIGGAQTVEAGVPSSG